LTRHVANIAGMKNTCKISVAKSGRKRPLRRPRSRWEDVKMGCYAIR